jgi:hypothetical protein
MTTRRSFIRTLAGIPLAAGSADALLASVLRANASGQPRFSTGGSAIPADAAEQSPFGQAATVPQGTALQASMWIYLWDIVDEGYDAVFQRLKDHRLTSISLATAYHAGKFLAPHNPKRKVVFLEDGTVYFRPNAALYGKIKPRVNSLIGKGHDLRKARERAAHAGLQTRSWVVCCHNTPLGKANPGIVTRTAFGDPLYHNLCPSNADVRAYLRALVKDVAAQGVAVIELEALQFQGYTHGEHHEREGVALGSVSRFLLGLCFCDACQKRTKQVGLDLNAVRGFVRTTLEESFVNPEAVADRYPALDALPSGLFQPFMEWRTNVVASLIQEVTEAAAPVAVRPMVSIDPVARRMVGMDPERVGAITGGILTPGYVKDGAALRPLLSQLQALLPDREITVGFQAGMPESGGMAEFLDRMKTAREMGITSFNFYNYGFIPLKNLEWIADSLAAG